MTWFPNGTIVVVEIFQAYLIHPAASLMNGKMIPFYGHDVSLYHMLKAEGMNVLDSVCRSTDHDIYL